MPEPVVVDAAALVDLLIGAPRGDAVRTRLADHELHSPAHFDAEVLSALGRLNRAGRLPDDAVEARLAVLTAAFIERHPLSALVRGAWGRRHNVRLVDALYVELSTQLGVPLVTTDSRMRGASPAVEVVTTEEW